MYLQKYVQVYHSPHQICHLLPTDILHLCKDSTGNRGLCTPFYNEYLSTFCYADIAILCSVIQITILSYRPQRKKEIVFSDSIPTTITLHDDTYPPEDILHRKKDARQLVEYLESNPVYTSAIGVSIEGEWGCGKTTFLQYMEEEYTQKGIHPIWFNPWKDNIKEIKLSFLNLLYDRFRNNHLTTSLLYDYESKIRVTNITNWFSLIVFSIKPLFGKKEKEFTDIKCELIRQMSMEKQATVVFIDDCDRLENSIFVEVISLIRTIADLPRFIVVVTFDPNQTDRALGDNGGRIYLKKIFNISHKLFTLSNRELSHYLTMEVKKMRIPLDEHDNPFDTFSLKEFLPTMRDAKHYLNLIDKDIKGYLDNEDLKNLTWRKWYLLELLKHCDAYLYTQLKNAPKQWFDQQKRVCRNWEFITPKKEWMEVQNEDMKRLLQALFCDKNSEFQPFDITNTMYYQCYFDPILPMSFLLHKEFYAIKNDEHLCDTFKELMQSGKRNLPHLIADFWHSLGYYYVLPVLEAYVYAKWETTHINTLESFFINTHYREIADCIKNEPWLCQITWESLGHTGFDGYQEEDKKGIPLFNKHLDEIKDISALAALFCSVTHQYTPTEYLDANYFLYELLKKELGNSSPDYATIVWIVADCVDPDLNKLFLDKFLNDHLTDVLPHILTFIENNEKRYILAKHDGLRGLFDTDDNFKKKIGKWRQEKRYPEELLNELSSLVYFTGIYQGQNPQRLESLHYPQLEQYKPQTISNLIPITSVKIKSDFWNERTRFMPTYDFYFAIDPNS